MNRVFTHTRTDSYNQVPSSAFRLLCPRALVLLSLRRCHEPNERLPARAAEPPCVLFSGRTLTFSLFLGFLISVLPNSQDFTVLFRAIAILGTVNGISNDEALE